MSEEKKENGYVRWKVFAIIVVIVTGLLTIVFGFTQANATKIEMNKDKTTSLELQVSNQLTKIMTKLGIEN